MIKLTHHEMPVNKTLHHRTIEILTVLTLLIGSPSFLIYFYCSHDTNNPIMPMGALYFEPYSRRWGILI